MPFKPGSPISMRIMSGRFFLQICTASVPLSASPKTTNSSLWRRMALMPSRMILWSSTRSTWNGMVSLTPTFGHALAGHERHRKAGADDTTLAGNTFGFEGHVVLGSIIVHQQLSQRRGTRVGHRGIIGDFEYEFALRAFYMNIDQRACGRRLGNVDGAFSDLVK